MEKLQHPNIVAIEERSDCTETQHPYIVMEYCSGGDLRKIIDRLKTLRYDTAKEKLHGLAELLQGNRNTRPFCLVCFRMYTQRLITDVSEISAV